MKIDHQGFLHLVRKVPVEDSKKSKPKSNKAKNRKPKLKDPKFKKGSWKQKLLDKLKAWRTSRYCEDFHFVKRENYAIISDEKNDQDELRGRGFFGKIKDGFMKKMSVSENSFVLVDTYDGLYTKVPLKTYQKLVKIHKIGISLTLLGVYDDPDDNEIVFQDECVIDNINDLMAYINHHRQGIDGVYAMQDYCCGFTYYDFKMKIVVWMRDGSVKTYKGDMNDFMKDFDLPRF